MQHDIESATTLVFLSWWELYYQNSQHNVFVSEQIIIIDSIFARHCFEDNWKKWFFVNHRYKGMKIVSVKRSPWNILEF